MNLRDTSLIGAAAMLSVLASGAIAQTAVKGTPGTIVATPAAGEHGGPHARTTIEARPTSGAASAASQSGPGAATAPVGDTTPSAKGGK